MTNDTKTTVRREPQVRVVRSRNRAKTVSARLVEDGAVLEILAPAQISDAELAPIIESLRERVLRRADSPGRGGDRELVERAGELNRQYFGGKLRWTQIRYVTNQNRRYGSCTPATGTIRLSHRVAKMPVWVRDYVLIHEMAHLVEANHGPRFWAIVNRYPKTERARGYLMALGLETDAEEPADSDLE